MTTDAPSGSIIAETSNLTTSTEAAHILPLTGLETPRPLVQIVLETLTLCVIWLFVVCGNVLVCIVIYRSRRLQSTTNYFVVSLALADVTLGILVMPFILVRVLSENTWTFGSGMCKFVRYVQYTCPGVTMYVLVGVCVDRYYTIIYPLSFKVTRSGAKRIITGSWAVMLILSAPTVYFFETQTRLPPDSFCLTYIPFTWQGTLYTAFLITVEYIVPAVTLVVGYTRVCKHIWTVGIGGRTFQRTTNPVPRTKVKVMKMLLILNGFMLVLLSPFYCVQIWYFSARIHFMQPTIFVTVSWLVFFAGMAKPLIYLIYNSNFRRGCKEVLCMSAMKCYRRNIYSVTTMSTIGKKNHVGMDSSLATGPQMNSPTKAFNRASQIHRTAWPLLNSSPSAPTTYL
ncbi:probable G-protein coupled receptor 19 [Lineus longissimus]|uniref:probable G-protein coupled receptor 19 n=1 Tax=Lineus longissimus TaxID=88925 RepID=UPI002B4F6726